MAPFAAAWACAAAAGPRGARATGSAWPPAASLPTFSSAPASELLPAPRLRFRAELPPSEASAIPPAAEDAAAEAAGASQADPEVWEVAGGSGVVYAIVRTPIDARRVVASGRFIHVYSLDEIANLLDNFPEVAKIKQTFPGAAVVPSRSWVADPLDGIPNAKTPLDDPIPF